MAIISRESTSVKPSVPVSPMGDTAPAVEAETLRLIEAVEETRSRYRHAVARAERARELAGRAEDAEGTRQDAMDAASRALEQHVLALFGLEHRCDGNGVQDPVLAQCGGYLVAAIQPAMDDCSWQVSVFRMDSLRTLAGALTA